MFKAQSGNSCAEGLQVFFFWSILMSACSLPDYGDSGESAWVRLQWTVIQRPRKLHSLTRENSFTHPMWPWTVRCQLAPVLFPSVFMLSALRKALRKRSCLVFYGDVSQPASGEPTDVFAPSTFLLPDTPRHGLSVGPQGPDWETLVHSFSALVLCAVDIWLF